MLDQSLPVTADTTIRIVVPILAATISAIVAVMIERFRNRLLDLRKSINYQLIGMSSVSDTWGEIRITYNNGPVNNLYFFNAEIINKSSKDAPKDMVVTFSLDPGSFFLREAGIVRNGDVSIGISQEQASLDYANDVSQRWFSLSEEERPPLQREVDHITTHRKFVLPILNRKTVASFEFLVGSYHQNIPLLSIGIYEPGISLNWLESVASRKKHKLWKNLIITLCWIGLTIPIWLYAPDVTWAVWLMFANTFIAYYLGIGITNLFKTFKIS